MLLRTDLVYGFSKYKIQKFKKNITFILIENINAEQWFIFFLKIDMFCLH